MSNPLEKWSKSECVKFLKTLKGAKVSGTKSELIERCKGYIDHPEILSTLNNQSDKTLKTALDITKLLHGKSIHWNPSHENLPCINFEQVENYLQIKKEGAQALHQKGHRLFVSRKIIDVQSSVVNDTIVVKAVVRPSMLSKAARPLYITFVDNSPAQAFCKCPAGKSGLCCHVAATLYAVEEHTRTGNLTLEVPCTSKLQTWHKNKPWRGNLTETTNIKIISAKKKVKKAVKVKNRATSTAVKSHLLTKENSTQRELRLVQTLHKHGHNQSSIMGVLKHRYSSLIVADHPYTQKTKSEINNFAGSNDNDKIHNLQNLTLSSLSKTCHTTEELISTLEKTFDDQMIHHIEEATRGQANKELWYNFRIGVVTASRAHRVYTKVNTIKKSVNKKEISNKSLLNDILGSSQINENIRALKYGREMEDKAVDCYFKIMQKEHQNLKVMENGLFICKGTSFIGASPDRLVSCECCGEGVLECKAPFSVCHTSPLSFESLQQLNFLKKSTSPMSRNEIILNRNHSYYTQCQMQLEATNRLYCDFFCWTPHGHFLERVRRDDDHITAVKENITFYFKKVIAPALLGKLV